MENADSLPAPRVSVCLPVFNGENFIEEALSSICQQDFEDFELIVTDNASTDATEEIVRKFAASDARIRYVRNAENIGAAENYNVGFRLARATYVKWMAHDDTLSPDFLRKMVAILDNEPSVSIAFGRTQSIDENSSPIDLQGTSMRQILDDDPQIRFVKALAGAGNCFPVFGLFRTDQLARSSLHRKNYYGSDRALIWEMMIIGKLRIDETATFYNRSHAKQSVAIGTRQELAQWQGSGEVRRSSMIRINRLIHLIEIAGMHPELAAPSRLYLAVAKYASRSENLRSYVFEIIHFLAPSWAEYLKPFAKRLLWVSSKPGKATDMSQRE